MQNYQEEVEHYQHYMLHMTIDLTTVAQYQLHKANRQIDLHDSHKYQQHTRHMRIDHSLIVMYQLHRVYMTLVQ